VCAVAPYKVASSFHTGSRAFLIGAVSIELLPTDILQYGRFRRFLHAASLDCALLSSSMPRASTTAPDAHGSQRPSADQCLAYARKATYTRHRDRLVAQPPSRRRQGPHAAALALRATRDYEDVGPAGYHSKQPRRLQNERDTETQRHRDVAAAADNNDTAAHPSLLVSCSSFSRRSLVCAALSLSLSLSLSRPGSIAAPLCRSSVVVLIADGFRR